MGKFSKSFADAFQTSAAQAQADAAATVREKLKAKLDIEKEEKLTKMEREKEVTAYQRIKEKAEQAGIPMNPILEQKGIDTSGLTQEEADKLETRLAIMPVEAANRLKQTKEILSAGTQAGLTPSENNRSTIERDKSLAGFETTDESLSRLERDILSRTEEGRAYLVQRDNEITQQLKTRADQLAIQSSKTTDEIARLEAGDIKGSTTESFIKEVFERRDLGRGQLKRGKAGRIGEYIVRTALPEKIEKKVISFINALKGRPATPSDIDQGKRIYGLLKNGDLEVMYAQSEFQQIPESDIRIIQAIIEEDKGIKKQYGFGEQKELITRQQILELLGKTEADVVKDYKPKIKDVNVGILGLDTELLKTRYFNQ